MGHYDAPMSTTTITSTAQLTPAKILGYAKGIAVTVGAILTVVSEAIPEDKEWKRYVQAGILVCTIIATIAIPNQVKPVEVVDPPGRHAVDSPGVQGVVQPPVVDQ